MPHYMSNLGIPLEFTKEWGYYGRISYNNVTLDSYVEPNGQSGIEPYSVDLTKPADPSQYPTAQELRESLKAAVGSVVVLDDGLVDMYQHLEGVDKYYSFSYGFSSLGNSRSNVIAAVGGAYILKDNKREFVPHDQIVTGEKEIDCPVAKAWGAQYKDCGHFWDSNNMSDFFYHHTPRSTLYRVQFTQASVSGKFQGKVSLYMNKKDMERDRKTAVRPGRAFKFLFPELTDVEIAKLVDKFNAKFPVVNLTLHEGKEEESFTKAYAYEQSVMQNVNTTGGRKSLANSCMRMRPEHEGLPKHPSAAYASGDFLSLWAEDDHGKIASRCVVYVPEEGKAQAGPVYGTSEIAIDLIESKLRDMDANLYDCASWIGARLLNIPCRNGVLAPYLDHEQALSEEGEFLVIVEGEEGDRNVDYYANTYSGVLGGGYTCVECDDRIDEDDVVHDDNGSCYCSDCYSDTFATCYESGNEHLRDDMYLCRIRTYRWGWQEEWVHDPESHDYVMIDFHYYHPDNIVTTEQGNQHLDGSGDYFVCEKSSEYHDTDQRVEARIHGRLYEVSKTWVEDNDYVMGNDYVYVAKEEEEKEAA